MTRMQECELIKPFNFLKAYFQANKIAKNANF